MNIRYKCCDTALLTLSVGIAIFVYPVLCVLICKIVIEFLLLHDKNKKLVSTIKRIIEVFPEGVVIRDTKESQLEKSTLFTNNSAQKYFQLDVNHLDDPSINQAKFIINDVENLDKIYTIEDVFKYAERRVEINERNDEICIEILQDKFDSSSSTGSSPRYFTMKTLNVEWESSKNSFMHVFVNISNIKRLEKERATNKCLHIMFASISHEFRTPLNAFTNSIDIIKLNFESLKQLLKSAEFKNDSILKKVESNQMSTEKFITAASISSQILSILTEDILDFAKIEAGMFSLINKPFLIRDLIRDIMFIYDFQCKQKGLNLIVNSEEVEDIVFNSDPNRIKQIMMNLISNAYKFTNEGSITLNFKIIHQIDCMNGSRVLKVEVVDTGVGISENDSKGLFQLFGTSNNQRDQFNMKGAGLGLTISQKLVTLLGGKISLFSNGQNGTKACFTIKEMENEYMEEVKYSRKNHQCRSAAPNNRNQMFLSTQLIENIPNNNLIEEDCHITIYL